MSARRLTVQRGGNKGGEKPKRVWTCTECQREGFWGPSWMWYGSLSDEDEGNIRFITCSDDCRSAARKRGAR